MKRCNNGYYSGYADTCHECPAGKKCPSPELLPVPCPDGEYSKAGATTCETWVQNTYISETGEMTVCGPGEDCDAMYVKPMKCPAGVTCLPDNLGNQPCATGSYSLAGD